MVVGEISNNKGLDSCNWKKNEFKKNYYLL